jgi:chromosome segregation ATPase
MKLVDLDIKMNEKYAQDIRLQKHKLNSITSLFGGGKKQATFSSEEAQSNNTAIELEAAIDKIIKQQSQRKADEERYQEQLQYFNMQDNEETQKLLRTLDKLTAKSQVVGSKVRKLNTLNERGNRHIQVLKAMVTSNSTHQLRREEPKTIR